MDQGIKKGDTIKFIGDSTDNFPKLQRQVATLKGSLTKALTNMEKQAVNYGSLGQGAMAEEEKEDGEDGSCPRTSRRRSLQVSDWGKEISLLLLMGS